MLKNDQDQFQMVMWQALIGQYGEWRIMTRVIIWLDKFRRWGLPHGII